MDTEQSRVIVTIGGECVDRLRPSPRFPRDPGGGRNAQGGRLPLVHQLTRALDSALTDWRRDRVNEAIADVQAFVGPAILDASGRTLARRSAMSPPMTTDTADSPPDEGPTGLVRELGTIDATMIVMGAMIGSGIFITSAESARLVGAPGWLLAAWALAGPDDDRRRDLPRPRSPP